MDGEPPLPDLEDVEGVSPVVVPTERDVIEAGTDDGDRDRPQEEIEEENEEEV